MGQKVHPFGFRLGVYEDWYAHWFAKKSYGKELIEDLQIREYIKKEFASSEISKIVIDKAGDSLRVAIFAGRPGVVIGKKGQGIEVFRNNFFKKFKKNIDVSVQEERNPELNSQLVALNIADQLERRAPFKRLMKKVAFAALKSGAKGIKICCSGRLDGAEIARTEWLRLGSTPLHTLRAKIDFATAEAHTKYGVIGVKVWICTGEQTHKSK